MYTFLTFGIGENEFEEFSADYVNTMLCIHAIVQKKEKLLMESARRA